MTHTFHVKIQYPYGCEFINSVIPFPTHTAVGRRPSRVNWWKRARRNGMRRTSHKGRPRCPQVSGDELPPQFCAEGHWFKCWVHRILQPQVCVIHGRQGMVRMYSTLTKAPQHAVVVISELLAAHGHQVAMVKPTYQQNPSTNAVTLSCSTSMKDQRPNSRGIVLETRIGDVGPGAQVSEYEN